MNPLARGVIDREARHERRIERRSDPFGELLRGHFGGDFLYGDRWYAAGGIEPGERAPVQIQGVDQLAGAAAARR